MAPLRKIPDEKALAQTPLLTTRVGNPITPKSQARPLESSYEKQAAIPSESGKDKNPDLQGRSACPGTIRKRRPNGRRHAC
jgi:hypothetical protein